MSRKECGMPIFMFQSVIERGHTMLGYEVHEDRERRLAEFRGPADGNCFLSKQFQCKKLRRLCRHFEGIDLRGCG